MPAPKADKARCDVPGCGMVAVACTDGNEVDIQGLSRKAIPNINYCDRHSNWPFSTDAERFKLDAVYQARK